MLCGGFVEISGKGRNEMFSTHVLVMGCALCVLGVSGIVCSFEAEEHVT